MKIVTMTAIMAVLVTIPLILGRRRKPVLIPVREQRSSKPGDEDRRYDIEDFLD